MQPVKQLKYISRWRNFDYRFSLFIFYLILYNICYFFALTSRNRRIIPLFVYDIIEKDLEDYELIRICFKNFLLINSCNINC